MPKTFGTPCILDRFRHSSVSSIVILVFLLPIYAAGFFNIDCKLLTAKLLTRNLTITCVITEPVF